MSPCRTASPFAMQERIPSSEISMPLPRTPFVRMSFASREPSPHPRSRTLAPRGTISRMMSWSILVPPGLTGSRLLLHGLPGKRHGQLPEPVEDPRRRAPDRPLPVIQEIHRVRFPQERGLRGPVPGKISEDRQGGVEDLRHLELVQQEPGVIRDPGYERLDEEAGDRRDGVHRAQERDVPRADPQLLLRLAQRG